MVEETTCGAALDVDVLQIAGTVGSLETNCEHQRSDEAKRSVNDAREITFSRNQTGAFQS